MSVRSSSGMNNIPLKTALAVLAMIAALLTGACSRSPVYETTLDNGLKVVVREDHRAPVVVSQIWYKVGAIDEPKGQTGISHVLEHMMFKGTKKHAPGEFSKIIAANGGRENAFTSRDYTAYFQQLEKSRLPVSFELEADRMRNLVFQEEEVRKEIRVVMEERRLRTEDQPESLTYEKFMAAAYTTHPYHNPIIGWMADLEALTLDNLQAWYRLWYAPNNATLVVVGDVEYAEVFKLARQHFGAIKPSKITRQTIAKEPPQKQPRETEVSAPAKVPYVILGYHAPSFSTAKTEWEPYALNILAGVLDGGESSRFARDIVRGKQIATSAGADYSPISRGPSLFLFDGTPARGHKIEELEQAILEQIDKVQKVLVDEAELNRVKAQVVASDVFSRDSVFYQAMRIGMLETVGLDHRMVDSLVSKLERVTAEQVREVARKYLVKQNQTRAELKPLPMDGGHPDNSKGGQHGAH